MPDRMNITELAGQHVELLPARTVLSMFSADGGGVAPGGANAWGTPSLNVLGLPLLPGGNSNAVGGAGTNANG
jgi:hypothetical protein